MGTTNPGGLPYPEGTGGVNLGANGIRDLAIAASIHANRVLGTLGNVGTFDAARPVFSYVGYTIANTDATGQLNIALPAGTTCLIAGFATPFVQSASEMVDVQWVLRVEQSSTTTTRWMARSTTSGGAYPSARMGLMFQLFLQ